MQTKQSNVTLCALSVMAFVTACVAHEAIGHGLACLATGGKVTLLTSVYFRCHPSVPFVDAAGPLMNLVAAGLSALAVRRCSQSSHARVFWALLLAFSGLWGAGYSIYSAIADTGDLAFVLRDLSLEPKWIWRIFLGISGIVLYRLIISNARDFLPRDRPLYLAYFSAVAVACISVLFYQGPILPALKVAALESAVAPIGLLLSGSRQKVMIPSDDPGFPASRIILALSVFITVIFWLTMGRGIYGS
ncbi:MAG: hypothetical protein QM581_02420 [Pseudomonas sp.]